MRRRMWAVLVVLLALGAPVAAQVPEAVVSRDVAVFAAGSNPATATPVVPLVNVPNAQANCNLPKPTGGTGAKVVNPTIIGFDDPANPTTRNCEVAPAVSGPLLNSVPYGSDYFVAVRARGATSVAAWSAASNPFDHVPVPPAVTTGALVR